MDSERGSLPWGQTMRCWEYYVNAGIRRVELTAPDMTGIVFEQKRSDEEKIVMQEHGLRFMRNVGAWLIRTNPETRAITIDLARQFADDRQNQNRRAAL